MSNASKSAAVPDDAVPRLPLGEVNLSVYAFESEVSRVTLRCTDNGVPLKIGELVEFEVVAIERRVTER